MARVEVNGVYGFVDRSGRIAIKPRFIRAGDFSEGLALVQLPRGDCELCGKLVYINKSGHVVIHMKQFAGERFGPSGDFSEGLARIYSEEGQPAFPNNLPYGYIDQTGRVVIPRKFGYADEFHEGLALVAKDFLRTGWGYINRQGEYAIEPKFADAGSFSEGLAPVKVLGRWGYIDRTGRVIVEAKFDNVWPFSEGYALVELKSRYGYIDHSGEFVIPAVFDRASPFSESLAAVKQGRTRGYIDKHGKFAITFRINVDDYEDFSGGVARVLVNYKPDYPMKIGYIDRRGRFIWKPRV